MCKRNQRTRTSLSEMLRSSSRFAFLLSILIAPSPVLNASSAVVDVPPSEVRLWAPYLEIHEIYSKFQDIKPEKRSLLDFNLRVAVSDKDMDLGELMFLIDEPTAGRV